MATLTSANAVIMLTVPGLFPAPIRLQGFAADDIFDIGQLENVETSMGVDGKFSAGYVYKEVEQGISLQADSASNDFFEVLYAAQKALKDVYQIGGVIQLPSVNRAYVLTDGYMKGFSVMPSAKKILQPRKFAIVWGSVIPTPA